LIYRGDAGKKFEIMSANYVLNLNLQNSLRQKGAKRPTQKTKKAKGGGKREKKHMKGGEGAWVFGMLYVTSHIA
jgi:hypothetical protein